MAARDSKALKQSKGWSHRKEQGANEHVSPLRVKALRAPGESLDKEIDTLLNDKIFDLVWIPFFFVSFAAIEWMGHLFNFPRQHWPFTAVAAGSAIYSFFKIRPLRAQLRNLRRGRDGERLVADQIDVLKAAGAQIFHDVPGDGFNLDHVVICPQGIFAIETKTWSKPNKNSQIEFDGQSVRITGKAPDVQPVNQVHAQVRWLQELLRISTGKQFPVKGVLVFPSWWIDRRKGSSESGLWVLEPKGLPKRVARESQRLSVEECGMASLHLGQYVRSRG